MIGDPNEDYERRDDLAFVIYESKEKMMTHDCSKYHPEVSDEIPDIKNLFVTGMESDALHEMDDE